MAVTNRSTRLPHCWPHQSCVSCLESSFHCGWCGSSQTCLPLPHHTSPLSAYSHAWTHYRLPTSICPTYDDRWELRTSACGCAVSSATVLAVLVTIACTILGLVVLWATAKGVGWAVSGWRDDGWETVMRDDGARKEGAWRRWRWRWWLWSEGEVEARRRLMLGQR